MNHVTYISAGAGSGKTFTLTSILADLIIKGNAEPEQFLLTTFTEKAAAEFKEKAKAKLYERAGCAEAAERLDQAKIGTIDSIAYGFVQKYWYLLGISPNLKLMDDDQKKFYIGQILASVSDRENGAFLKDFCEQFGIGFPFGEMKVGLNYDFWKDDVKNIFEKMKSFNIANLSDSRSKSIEIATAIFGNKDVAFDETKFRELVGEIKRIDANGRQSATRTSALKNVEISLSRGMKICDTVAFKKLLLKDLPDKPSKSGKPGKFQELKETELYQEVLSCLNEAYNSKRTRDYVLKYINLIFDYVEDSEKKFEEFKNSHHLIDFTDMEVYFLKLLDMPEVQDDIRNTFKYVFVDEFQDSSPIQVKIFDKLSEIVGRDECDNLEVAVGSGDSAKKFRIHSSIWVGDVKQAIYGFRGADTDLTKAVSDIIGKKAGSCPKQFAVDTLKTSYRSKENVVKFTNEIFVKAFADVLHEDMVKLDVAPGKENDGLPCLKYWSITGSNATERTKDVALQIAKRVYDGEKASCYAVLARDNISLDAISGELKKLGVPVCRKTGVAANSDELSLLAALLHLVQNDRDDYSRAVVAFLTERDFTAGKIIDSRLEYNAKSKKESLYLADNEILSKFAKRLSHYKALTIHNLVESLVIDLDLCAIGRSWAKSTGTDEVFMALVEAAHDYEEYCTQLMLPPTVDGYLDFCKENAKSMGSKDGVVLETFHYSKGLEWQKVVLLSLDDDVKDERKLIKRNIFGAQLYHDKAPSEANLYPPMIINLLPNLFTGNRNVDEVIGNKILMSEHFSRSKERAIAEVKRLMYVAVTRARDELILTASDDDAFKVFENIGTPHTNTAAGDQEQGVDLFGCGLPFVYEDGRFDESDLKLPSQTEKIVLKANESAETVLRDMQPSKYKSSKYSSAADVPVKLLCDFGKRIMFSGAGEMDKLGTCLHNVFCVLEKDPKVDVARKIIRDQGMDSRIPNPSEVLDAWNNLEKFLTEKYGAKVATYHELPFKHMHDGQIFTGSIDLLWETDKGVVLVDYKSYPGNSTDVVDPKNEHFAGMYAGQFECYENALKAAKKDILAKVIYYHILGVCVDIK